MKKQNKDRFGIKEIKDKGSMITRISLYPFGRLAFKYNIEAKEGSVNLGDMRTFRRHRKDLKIGVKLPSGDQETYYLARSKLAKVESLELEVVEA